MHLTRCQDQRYQTLDEFYSDLCHSEEPTTRAVGGSTLDLIARLRAVPDERHIYGLTSLYRLCLLAEDTYASPWFVIVTPGQAQFYVQYLLPQRLAPWSGAYVTGEARTVDEAVRMILTAMERSEGWSRYSGLAISSERRCRDVDLKRRWDCVVSGMSLSDAARLMGFAFHRDSAGPERDLYSHQVGDDLTFSLVVSSRTGRILERQDIAALDELAGPGSPESEEA